jgi:hypothetical protein
LYPIVELLSSGNTPFVIWGKQKLCIGWNVRTLHLDVTILMFE